MNKLINLGRKRTILISISILIVSMHTIYFYHAVRPEVETKKLIQQAIRFLLTIGLLIETYKGKNWARTATSILFGFGALLALFTVLIPSATFLAKIPLLVMIFIYSVGAYHFGFSKSYQAFFDAQNEQTA